MKTIFDTKPDWALRVILYKLYEEDTTNFQFLENPVVPGEIMMTFIHRSIILVRRGDESAAVGLEKALKILFLNEEHGAENEKWLEEELTKLLRANIAEDYVRVEDILNLWDIKNKVDETLYPFITSSSPRRVTRYKIDRLLNYNSLFRAEIKKIIPDKRLSKIFLKDYLDTLANVKERIEKSEYYDLTCLAVFIKERMIKPTIKIKEELD